MDNKDNITNDKKILQEKCESFLNISDKIRYVGIINRFGRTVAGKLKKNIRPLLTPEQARDERFIESARQLFRNSLDSSIGKSLFTISKNENVFLVLIPNKTQDLQYYITIEKDAKMPEISEIIDRINDIERQK